MYAAAEVFVHEALGSDGSVFTPGRPIWSAPLIDDLHSRFNLQPDLSGSTFMEKFARQLAGAPTETVQLAGEMMFVHLLIAHDVGGDRKRELITTILGWASIEITIPDRLAQALDHGLCNSGVSFKTHRPMQLWLIIDFLRAWKAATPTKQRQLLADPWGFKEMLFSIPQRAANAQREALLHLVFPDTFEVIVSQEHKRRITTAFGALLGVRSSGDVDRDLGVIRTRLAEDHGPDFHFYDEGVVETWREGGPPKEADDSAGARRAWLVRGANVGGRNMIPEWLEQGFCSIGWDELGDLSADIRRAELAARLREGYPDKADGAIRADAGTLLRFITQMATGDYVVTVDGAKVYVGVVAGDVVWSPDGPAHTSRRRDVEWSNADDPFERAELPPPLRTASGAACRVRSQSGPPSR